MSDPEQYKPDDLAAALKRRIDPADLYNVTIRPVAGEPPRVEIILPTGGQRQQNAEMASLAYPAERGRGQISSRPRAAIPTRVSRSARKKF